MKIIYLAHQFYPEFQAGTEKFVFNNAYMAQKSGNKVKVITYCQSGVSSFPYRSGEVLFKEYQHEGIQVLAYRYEKESGDLNLVIDPDISLDFALEILQQERPDLIHVGHLMRVYPFILAAKQLGVPYLLTLTDFHLLCPKILLTPTEDTLCSGPEKGHSCAKFCSEFSPAFIRSRLNTATDIVNGASAVIAPSHFVSGIFEHEVDGLQVLLNHHGIRQSNIKAREQVYQPGDTIRFGYIGNLTFHKGVHVLIKAFTEMNSLRASLSIFGPGEGAYPRKLVEIASGAAIYFKGSFQSEDLRNVFGQMDVLVVPSICYETYSFVVHEALATEIPVIASNLGGMAEDIENGIHGFSFTAGDVQSLREVMQKILNDPTILNKFKSQIRLSSFVPTIEQEAYRYNQIYKMVVK